MKLLANLLLGSIFVGISPNKAQASQIATKESDFALSQVIEPEKVTSVSQLAEVQPTDWENLAIHSLFERYGVAGYQNGSWRNRALTRYEFAAGLNAVLDHINQLIASGNGSRLERQDLLILQKLQAEFAAELAILGDRLDVLESRTAELAANQFALYTKFNASATFGLSQAFVEAGADENTVLQQRVRINFDTSFTGTDQLRTRLQAGNFSAFNFVGDITNEAQLAYGTDTSNDIVLNDLFYNFRIGEKLSVYLLVNSGEWDDFVTVVETLITATGTGAISNFSFNHIYNAGGQGAGIGADYQITDAVKLSFGYQSGEANNPDNSNGLFNGDYSVLGRLEYGTEAFQIAVAYLHTYDDTALNTNEAGSVRSQVITGLPVVGNHYGVEASLNVSPGFRVSAWGGFSNATVLGFGDAEVWNYAVTLIFPDFGKEGSLLGFVVGVEPYLAGTDGFTVPDGQGNARRSDPDTGLHIEGFYRYQLTDNLSITPGVIWLTAPGHNEDNSDIVVGTIRTTFQF